MTERGPGHAAPTADDLHAAEELLRCYDVGMPELTTKQAAFVEDLGRLFMYRRLFETCNDTGVVQLDQIRSMAEKLGANLPPLPERRVLPHADVLERFAKALTWASAEARGRLPDWFHEITKEAESWARGTPGAAATVSNVAARVLQLEKALERLVAGFRKAYETTQTRDGGDLSIDNVVDEVVDALEAMPNLADKLEERDEELAELRVTVAELEKPIPMRLPCPGTVSDGSGGLRSCGQLHVDEGEFATKPHHTHSCQHCGMTWRPSVRATVGVTFLPGFRNADEAAQTEGPQDASAMIEVERLLDQAGVQRLAVVSDRVKQLIADFEHQRKSAADSEHNYFAVINYLMTLQKPGETFSAVAARLVRESWAHETLRDAIRDMVRTYGEESDTAEDGTRVATLGNILARLSRSARDAAEASSPDDIRAQGWTVGVHNDYRLAGRSHTFWLFTKGDRCVKGEGETDAAALAAVRAQIRKLADG